MDRRPAPTPGRRVHGRALLTLLLLAPCLAACSSLTSSEPALPDSTLVEVLLEFHLANARSGLAAPLSASVRDSVLTLHGIDEAAFEETMRHYADRPEAFSQLYTEVLDRLTAERSALLRHYGLPQDSLPSPYDLPPQVEDSLRKK